MSSVMPQEWIEHGAPARAMAAYAEGACPVHLTPLSAGTFPVGGKGTMARQDIPGGWCETCRAWWHRPYGRSAEILGGTDGLGATWDQAGCRAADAVSGVLPPVP